MLNRVGSKHATKPSPYRNKHGKHEGHDQNPDWQPHQRTKTKESGHAGAWNDEL